MTRLQAGQANRGMALEALVNHTNEVYRSRGMAVVHKRPTPVKIVRTQGTRVLSAFLEAASTVDYEGTYRGRSLQFEAKQTKIESRFDFDNIHSHQVEHLRASMHQGAVCFLILEFTKRNEIYYVPGKMLVDAWDMGNQGARRSIPYDDIMRMCYLVRPGRGVACDYLAIVDKLVEKGPLSFQVP